MDYIKVFISRWWLIIAKISEMVLFTNSSYHICTAYCLQSPKFIPIKHKSNYIISLLKACSSTQLLRRPYVPICPGQSCFMPLVPALVLHFYFIYQSGNINVCLKRNHTAFNGPPLYTSSSCHRLFWYCVRSMCNE